jgi:hypothetical protein
METKRARVLAETARLGLVPMGGADSADDRGSERDAAIQRESDEFQRAVEEAAAAQIAEHQRLAAERTAQLQARDAELADVRRLAEEREQALQEANQARLEAHRRALLAEHRGHLVEDLVQGASIAELDASVERARSAYASVADQVRQQAGERVPPGNPSRDSQRVDPAQLSPQEKIRHALERGTGEY